MFAKNPPSSLPDKQIISPAQGHFLLAISEKQYMVSPILPHFVPFEPISYIIRMALKILRLAISQYSEFNSIPNHLR